MPVCREKKANKYFLQFDAETSYLENGQLPLQHHYFPAVGTGGPQASAAAPAASAAAAPPSSDSQIELVLSEVRRLEEVAQRNDDELGSLKEHHHHQQQQQLQQLTSDDMVIKSEISQLRQRLAGTDQELQKTNMTLRFAILLLLVLVYSRTPICTVHQ